jgi:aminopeptidase N
MHYLASGLSGNRVGRPLLWQYLRDNWDHVNAKLGGNPIILDRLIGLSLGRFSDYETLAEIEKFFAGVSTKGFDRTLGAALDKIRARAAYKTRDAGGLKAWLVENKYV